MWRAGGNATLQVLDDESTEQFDQPCSTTGQPFTPEQMATTSKQLLEKELLSCAGETSHYLASKQSDQVY